MARPKKLRFIDLFSGCGGLSLGLFQAGLTGLFGVELAPEAFGTLKANFMTGKQPNYAWPRWLERRAWDIGDLIDTHRENLRGLRGEVDLVCGGPPCQGFSLYGKRNRDDSRNKMVGEYARFVKLVQPTYVLLENVRGFNVPYGLLARDARNGSTKGRKPRPFSDALVAMLDKDYVLDSCLLSATQFGVPQERERFFILGIRRSTGFSEPKFGGWGQKRMLEIRKPFLEANGLPLSPVTAEQAIGDLETDGLRRTLEYTPEGGCNSPGGFLQVNYVPPTDGPTPYVELMRKGLNGQKPTGLRLANHTSKVRERLKLIVDSYRQGCMLSVADRKELGTKKQRLVPLAADKPAHTLTTLPDDLVHYKEPRILTVRESARLQSFPDWFNFTGKYTTGGARRRFECPRYTQVGNAVPPLVAEAWGIAIRSLHRDLNSSG